MTSYIGIDPGKSGAIAVLGETNEVIVCECKNTEHDVWTFLTNSSRGNTHALIEKVHAMPKQGVTSTFNFGMSYGFLRGILIASTTPFEAVTPRTWQKRYGLLRKKGETDTQKKNRHKAKAQELFPNAKVTLATVDALLIAHYCREQHVEPPTLKGLI